MQETFVKALANIEHFRGECKLSVWLCQIAKNMWISQLRRKKVVSGIVDDLHVCDSYLGEWADIFLKLEEPYKSIFFKKTLYEMSYEEIAKEFAKSESWARVTYYRARLKIQEMLKEGSGDSEK